MKKLASAAAVAALGILAAQAIYKHQDRQAVPVLSAAEKQTLRDAPNSGPDSNSNGDAKGILSQLQAAYDQNAPQIEAAAAKIEDDKTLSEARRREIESYLERSDAIRANALEMLATFYKTVPAAVNVMEKAKQVVYDGLNKDFVRVRRIERSLRTELESGKISQKAYNFRYEALLKIDRLGAVFIYGFALPRLVDEVIKDDNGKYAGRKYAGPKWEILLTLDEFEKMHKFYVGQTGCPWKQTSPDQHRTTDELRAKGRQIGDRAAAISRALGARDFGFEEELEKMPGPQP